MAINKGKQYLTLEDLKQYSIWKTSDIDDLDYPVTCSDDFPEDQYDLSIRTIFTTPSGIKLMGFLVGIKNVFSIAIYVDDQVFYFNRNLQGDYPETLEKLSKALGQEITMKDFSPLKYVTDIDLPGFKNIEGEFDLMKKRTEEERLESL